MLNILGSIFGSKSVLDNGMKAIDALIFTDEEKTQKKLELLKAYEPFKLAQRYLAFMFCGQFILTFNVCLVMKLLDKDIKPIIDLVVAFSLGQIVLAIVAFYFLGGVANGFGKK